MTLDEYLYENNLTVKQFADSIGYAPQYVSSCKNGTRPVPDRMSYLIHKATNGKVKLGTFIQ